LGPPSKPRGTTLGIRPAHGAVVEHGINVKVALQCPVCPYLADLSLGIAITDDEWKLWDVFHSPILGVFLHAL
jgi:hypothetical protein